jgi:hypothetical protein
MTATLDFIIEQAGDVMKVPNAALRFQATQGMMALLQQQREERMATLPDSVRERMEQSRGDRQGGQQGAQQGAQQGGQQGAQQGGTFAAAGGQQGGFGRGAGGRNSDTAMLWYLDENGQLAVARVRKGLTDGQMTQVIGRDIEPGMQIIVGVTQAFEEQEDESSFNPFQNQQQDGGRRFGAF